MKIKKISYLLFVFAMLIELLANIDDRNIYAATEPHFSFETEDGEPVTKINIMNGYECYVYYVDDILKSNPDKSYEFRWKSANKKIVKIDSYGGNTKTGYRWAKLKMKGIGKTKITHYDDQGKKIDYLSIVVKDRINLKIRGIKINSNNVSFNVTNKSDKTIKMTGCTKDNYHFEDEYESVEETGTLLSSNVTIKGGETRTVTAKFKTDIKSGDDLNFFVEKYGIKYTYELKKFNIFRWYCRRSFLDEPLYIDK